ncbi:zeta toxin family protein [Mucilaginibacter sp. AW1-3]
MEQPEFVMVAGCNAAGKSSFIRSRIAELPSFEIIMTDVYKSRTKTVFQEALQARKDIILETVFNDASFRTLVDEARHAGYHTSLVVLFLDSPQESIDRVAFRSLQQNGLTISGSNIRLNFNESFKNIATYYFYFNRADFIYTGIANENHHIMGFDGLRLTEYQQTDLRYPQKFAQFGHQQDRLDPESYQRIQANQDYQLGSVQQEQMTKPKVTRNFRL